MIRYILPLSLVVLVALPAWAHDTWVETNTPLIRVGDAVYVDLKLGNHGNDHRDFKLASKVSLEASTLHVVDPEASRHDIRSCLRDMGYAANEGYWKAKFAAADPGLYMVAHKFDRVVHYAPTRSIKSAKTFFVASESLDHVPEEHSGFDRVLGHPLELVPRSNPVTPMGPGHSLEVQLLYKGRPLSNHKVSFIPRGHTLKEGFDPQYERMTDCEGRVRFTPNTGNVFLIVAHHSDPEEAGENYENIKFSATLTVSVPNVCPVRWRGEMATPKIDRESRKRAR